jgi:hypothetical protein
MPACPPFIKDLYDRDGLLENLRQAEMPVLLP